MLRSLTFSQLTRTQRNAFIAALAGWSLDAFDFFLFVFCLRAIGGEFHTSIKTVAEGIFLTLAFRPLGALFFGWLAERYGRRPILMVNVISYSVVELATAFAPDMTTLLALRALFGFAMGGEWGVGAALALETLPARGRGFFSGLLQEGYVIGYLLASIVFGYLFVHVGWRGMFVIGAAPALLVLYIRTKVEESPAWLAAVCLAATDRGTARDVAGANSRERGESDERTSITPKTNAGLAMPRASAAEIWKAARAHFPTFIFLIVLMACFNAFSHGSQDLYPTFLQSQHGFSAETTGNIAIVMNTGALLGGMFFGALSEKIGRRRAIMLAAALALPMIWPWAYARSATMFALGAFAMQFMIQGAWGIVPAHLNELSPPSVRAILPGFAYQLGNLAMAYMGPLQAGLAEAHGGDYAAVLAWTMGIVAAALIVVTALGREARSTELRVTR